MIKSYDTALCVCVWCVYECVHRKDEHWAFCVCVYGRYECAHVEDRTLGRFLSQPYFGEQAFPRIWNSM